MSQPLPAAPVARQPLAEGTFQQSVFEGLFIHTLKAEGPLADLLRKEGYDLDHQQAVYPARVWRACLEAACRHLHPELPLQEAMQRLGTRFLDGFFSTIAGKLLSVTLPLVGPSVIMRRLPRFFAMGATGVGVSVQQEADRVWRVRVDTAVPVADFDAGVIASALTHAGVKPYVSVVARNAQGHALQVRWDEKASA
jgi:uncharacterized protein (TIGR02265 family)